MCEELKIYIDNEYVVIDPIDEACAFFYDIYMPRITGKKEFIEMIDHLVRKQWVTKQVLADIIIKMIEWK